MTQPSKKKTVTEIKELLKTMSDEKDERLPIILKDERVGVQKAIASWRKSLQKVRQLEEKREALLMYEKELWGKEFSCIAGIDEVGRGPLAGPVVAAAVILPGDLSILGIDDSKKLSVSKREKLFDEIQESAISVGIGIVEASLIDEMNILQATKLAMKQAIENLSVLPDHLLIDAVELPLAIPQTKIIKGDSISLSIAAASIIAKVTRDRMMEEYEALYPGYGFARNAGYGTAEHLNGLREKGPCPIHRFSFAPVSNYAE